MTGLAFAMIVLSVASLVTGQIVLKHAMGMTHEKPIHWKRFLPKLSLGIAIMTLWFFLWLSLLQTLDLSFVFPFEGLSCVFLSLGAMIFLKEKLTLRLWIGMILIVIGVIFVSAS